MRDVGPPNYGPPGPEPSMEDILRADSFIDALAGGRPVAPQDAVDAELAVLLGSWREETRWPPDTGLISESDAIAALNAGLGEKRRGSVRERRSTPTSITPRRSRRGLSVVGAAAAAVLTIGGFGAVVSTAGPGDSLYGLRTMLFGAPKQVRDDQVALAARTEMQQVQNLIAQGNWEQAQDKLVAVSSQVASIGDGQQKQELLEQFNDLSAKVVERNPEATAPPGITYTVPPAATELVPAVAPTSTPGAPPPSDSVTSSATTSGSPSSESASASTEPSSAASSTAGTTATSGTQSATSAAPSTSASQQSQQATSATPTTTAAPSTSSASSATRTSGAATATPTTTAPAAAAETSAAETSAAETSAGAAAAETEATAESEATAEAEATAESEASAEAEATAESETTAESTVAETTAVQTFESEEPAAVTTTAVIPAPVEVGG